MSHCGSHPGHEVSRETPGGRKPRDIETETISHMNITVTAVNPEDHPAETIQGPEMIDHVIATAVDASIGPATDVRDMSTAPQTAKTSAPAGNRAEETTTDAPKAGAETAVRKVKKNSMTLPNKNPEAPGLQVSKPQARGRGGP